MKTPEPELLLCPFCGGEAEYRDDGQIGRVQCQQCLMQTDGSYSWRDKDWKEAEANAWNARVYPPEVQAAIERDTPKKPIFPTIKEQSEDREDMPRCPDCVNNMDKVIGRARQSHSSHGVIRTVEYNLYGWNVQPFCPECGQRLDWSEE